MKKKFKFESEVWIAKDPLYWEEPQILEHLETFINQRGLEWELYEFLSKIYKKERDELEREMTLMENDYKDV